MAQIHVLRQQILQAVSTQLIPWVSEGSPFILLDAPPAIIGSNLILEQPGRKLALQRGAGLKMRVQAWPEENLNMMAVPYMGCVVEGEADIITGTTTAMCRTREIAGKRWIINAPQKSLFLAPPQVPLSRGERPHWERPNPENAYSRILWLQFHTTGVNCHFCTSERGKHWSHPYYFIYGQEFFPLAKSLIREMTEMAPHYVPLVYSHLSTLFHHMLRSLVAKPSEEGLEELPAVVAPVLDSADALIREAVDFIDQNLHERLLTVEQIAAHLHFSPRHLARVFRREMGVSVMEFVTRRRMELACQLLIESQFGVAKIGGYCGYTSSTSFIKAFVRRFDSSPTAYRQAHRNNVRFDL